MWGKNEVELKMGILDAKRRYMLYPNRRSEILAWGDLK
jgi:hypothetical protein